MPISEKFIAILKFLDEAPNAYVSLSFWLTTTSILIIYIIFIHWFYHYKI